MFLQCNNKNLQTFTVNSRRSDKIIIGIFWYLIAAVIFYAAPSKVI